MAQKPASDLSGFRTEGQQGSFTAAFFLAEAMIKRTALFDAHVKLGAKLVDFGGWEMPLHYGSQLEEHHIVRRDAGMFDVSHMTVVELEGSDARSFLRRLLANDIAKAKNPGQALYTCMLNDTGGVLDDLIVYHLDRARFRLVLNAATRDKDLAWIKKQAGGFGVSIRERDDLAMIAVQGPAAREKAASVMNEDHREKALDLPRFQAGEFGELFVARTGYTGEDGFETLLPAKEAEAWWEAFRGAGIMPCGLGARDTLRLEAGMNLYGSDMDETTTPLESALGWTVAWLPEDRQFIGREALGAQKQAGIERKLVGLLLEGKGVLRAHQKVSLPGGGAGEITSGTYSPSLSRSIALARVPVAAESSCEVEIRGRMEPARIVKPPFVRNGKPCINL